MGKRIVVIGTQWGDEGKGKIVDLLTDVASAVVRFQAGQKQFPVFLFLFIRMHRITSLFAFLFS